MNGFMSLTPGAPGAAPQQRQPMPPQMPGRGGAMPPGPPQGRPAMSGGRPIQAGAPMPGGPSPMPMPQPAAQPLHPQAGGFMDLSPGPVPGAQQLAQMGRRGDTELAHVNPAENQELAARISGSGALISQFPPDAPRSSTSFLIRNHVIAGLSATSVVMAGEERSGSRNEAQAAVGYGRAVLLWEPELGARKWATRMVHDEHARFFSTPDEAVAEMVSA